MTKIFDWESLNLTDAEISARMIRAGGDVKCEICGKLYYDHPYEIRVKNGIDNKPFLHQSCDGKLLKL